MNGLLVRILKTTDYHCTNGGISERVDRAVLTGSGIPEIFAPSPDAPELCFVERGTSPYCTPTEKHRVLDRTGWMFGGNFVYSSDSRFPSNQPIAIHDRQETIADYRRLTA